MRWGSFPSVDEPRLWRHASGAGCVKGYARVIINNEFVEYRIERVDRESSEVYKVLKTIDKKKKRITVVTDIMMPTSL